MQYTLVTENNDEALVRKVTELIRQGWKPQGGIAVGVVAPVLNVHIFCQAMVKEQV